MDVHVDQITQLLQFIYACRPLFVITGAGCSTESGVPAYRNHRGQWQQPRPVQYGDFVTNAGTRRRYWARSMVGWPRIARAQPNNAHHGLRRLQTLGVVGCLVTQNVDSLHSKAGSRHLELHGNLASVRCRDCGSRYSRWLMQHMLLRRNPDFRRKAGHLQADGNMAVDADYTDFKLVDCPLCGGILRPDVVFFGEAVPRRMMREALSGLADCRGVLVAGSSLAVHSGYRFCRRAADRGLPQAAINLGTTRADPLLQVKINDRCGPTLAAVADWLEQHGHQ